MCVRDHFFSLVLISYYCICWNFLFRVTLKALKQQSCLCSVRKIFSIGITKSKSSLILIFIMFSHGLLTRAVVLCLCVQFCFSIDNRMILAACRGWWYRAADCGGNQRKRRWIESFTVVNQWFVSQGASLVLLCLLCGAFACVGTCDSWNLPF